MKGTLGLRRAGIPIIMGALLATGFTGVTSSAAEAAARCGLSGSYRSGAAAGTYVYSYVIRNCHHYRVARKIDVARFWDGPCITIPAGASRKGSLVLPVGASIRGLKRC